MVAVKAHLTFVDLRGLFLSSGKWIRFGILGLFVLPGSTMLDGGVGMCWEQTRQTKVLFLKVFSAEP